MDYNDYLVIQAEKRQEQSIKRADNFLKLLSDSYIMASNKIEKDIFFYIGRFAINNKMSLVEARKLLDSEDVKKYKLSLEEYKRLAESGDLSNKVVKMLENASTVHRLSRLQALNVNVNLEVDRLYKKYGKEIFKLLGDEFEEDYYSFNFDLQKISKYKKIKMLDSHRIEAIINRPWASDGVILTDRIERNKVKLVNEIQKELMISLMGDNTIDSAVDNISKKMKISYSNANNLVHTEMRYAGSEAKKQAYKDIGVDRYQISATLDSRTSDICQKLDRRIYKLSEYVSGVTAPPFHNRCRTTTVPYYEDILPSFRVARDNKSGNDIIIDSNISYVNWKNKYID